MKLTWSNSEKEVCSKILGAKCDQEIPLGSENRRKTDEWFFYVFISCIILLVPLLVYTLIYSDINRYNGYDDCGNICGQKNVRYEQWRCSGQDMTLKPYSAFSDCYTKEEINRKGYEYWSKDKGVYTNVKRHCMAFVLSFFVPLGFSLILALLFRYVTNVAVVAILCVSWLSFPAIAVISTIIILLTSSSLLLIFPAISLILFCVSFNMWNKIALVIKLFRKAAQAVSALRNITINAAVTLVLSMVIVAIYWIIKFCTNPHITGILETYSDRLEYVPNGYMVATQFLSFIVVFWIIQFIIGITSLTASGAIANRYFLRNKEGISSSETIKFHSGTVAFTSLLSTIMLLPRLMLIVLGQLSMLKGFANFFMSFLESFFSKNVYIMTALHGSSIFESGMRHLKICKSSVGNTEFVRFFADFVIVSTQVIITFSSVLVFAVTHHDPPDTILDFAVLIGIAYSCTEAILGPFKVAVNTIFFCICQDNLLQKEANQPYTMSKREYLDVANKFFADKVDDTWLSRNTEHVERI